MGIGFLFFKKVKLWGCFVMNKNRQKGLSFLDLIPAVSGLVGKIALASSFAFMWAQGLGIDNESFVFENVRVELLIGCLVTLIAALIFPKASPTGTLAPLIVLVPIMITFGVHPLVLGVSIGVIGIIAAKTGILLKLTRISGQISRNSLTLAFGVSGIILCIQKLHSFFQKEALALIALLVVLSAIYIILFKLKIAYYIIPISAVISIIIPVVFGLGLDFSFVKADFNLSPSYWWNEMWGIGYGFDIKTILVTVPFAFFVVFLWTIDTVSIQVLQESSYQEGDIKQEIEIKQSFIIVAIRNTAGAVFGGAQTGSLWRSFLIPLFMIKRPMRASAILMGLLGIIFSLTSLPVSILSYSPLVWSVLLFGIFIPFIVASLMNIFKADKRSTKLATVLLSLSGILINPMITWVTAVIYEKIFARQQSKN